MNNESIEQIIDHGFVPEVFLLREGEVTVVLWADGHKIAFFATGLNFDEVWKRAERWALDNFVDRVLGKK